MNARAGIAAPRELPANGPIVEPDSPTDAAWDAAVPFPDLLKSGSPGSTETADPVAAPVRDASPPGRKAAFSLARLGAFLSSTVIHILVLTLAAGALVVAGREPPKEETVSVEIVLEAPAKPVPPAQPEEASDAAAAQNPPPAAKAEEVKTPPEEHETAHDRPSPEAKSIVATTVEEKAPVQVPVPDTAQPLPPEDAQAVAVPEPDRSALSILSVPPVVPVPAAPATPSVSQNAAAKVESPREATRPAESRAKPEKAHTVERQEPARVREHRAATKESAVHKETRKEKVLIKRTEKPDVPREKTETNRKEQDRKTGVNRNGAARPRTAAASPGEKAAYARKLLTHVQRYKRYPLAAERAGITGAARLSITIDRSGSVRGARLVSSAGNALLDKEAMEVAHRASPYPPPPPGMGGSTFSFIVTLRFSR